jgi:hypothetical protein
VTFIKKLDVATKINSDAVANFSTIVKDIVIQTYDKYKESTRDFVWLNHNLFDQSVLHTAIRQLEFALLQMIQQINELLGTIQSVL